METKEDYIKRLKKAQKKVENIKNFYRHLRVYMVINIILFFLIYGAMDFFGKNSFQNQGFINWYLWNLIGTPVLWGIGLLFHALYVFGLKSRTLSELKPKFLKDWEERQIKKYMEEN